MASETVRAVKLAALPTTPDEATRSAEVIVATEATIGGMVLQCREGAVVFPPGPVPLLLDHEAKVGAIAGRLERFELTGGELRALAVVADGPASEAAWPLVRSGAVGVSVRAEILDSTPGGLGQPEIATRWRIREASLTPLPADPACIVRSAATETNHAPEGHAMTTQTTTTTEAAEAAAQPTAREIRRARELTREVERLVGFAPAEAAEAIRTAAETEGLAAARAMAIDAIAEHQQRTQPDTQLRSWCPSMAGANDHTRSRTSIWSPATNGSQAGATLADTVLRSWEGKADQPLWLELRAMGHRGSNPVEVLRSALSTTDLPMALIGAGNRQLLAQFAAAPQGVRVAASVRQLSDYRSASTLDVGLVGKAQQIREGGEIKFGSASEQGASYKPTRHGLGLSFTPESLANDDLAGLDRAIAELGAAMLEAEAEALAALLEGNALGAIGPDGKRLFHADHSNTVAGPLGIGSLGDAVAKLRQQTTIGGRFLYQEPGAILCAPGVELTVRQLLSDAVRAAEPANVNPWQGLEVAVDPHIGEQFVYLLPAGARRPLELGRLSPAPVLESETQFETGFFRTKAEHAFGCAAVDHRPIVRLTVAA